MSLILHWHWKGSPSGNCTTKSLFETFDSFGFDSVAWDEYMTNKQGTLENISSGFWSFRAKSSAPMSGNMSFIMSEFGGPRTQMNVLG